MNTRDAKRREWAISSLQLGIFVAVFGIWEMGARIGIIDTFFFSQPSSFLSRAWMWLTNPSAQLGGRSIYQHLAVTLYEMAASFLLGVVSGVAVGIVLGRSDFWARVFNPYIQVLNALPRLVLAPIFVL